MSEAVLSTPAPAPAPAAAPAAPAARGRAGAFPTPRARRRYWTVVAVLALASAGFAFGLLAWDNPMPVGSDGFWRIADRRVTSVVIMAVVAFCQAIATVSFQTATNNRIITPSIMGGHEVCQPVAVEGAQPGDGVAIRIKDISVASIALAVVLALHGAAMNGSMMVWFSGLSKKADEAAAQAFAAKAQEDAMAAQAG